MGTAYFYCRLSRQRHPGMSFYIELRKRKSIQISFNHPMLYCLTVFVENLNSLFSHMFSEPEKIKEDLGHILTEVKKIL